MSSYQFSRKFFLRIHFFLNVSRYRDSQLQVDHNYSYLFKGTPWDDINVGILFCMKQCIRQIMISIKKKYINIFK